MIKLKAANLSKRLAWNLPILGANGLDMYIKKLLPPWPAGPSNLNLAMTKLRVCLAQIEV